ncbi:hypothetical protein [Infirmifilum sp. SLHALR2]
MVVESVAFMLVLKPQPQVALLAITVLLAILVEGLNLLREG